MLNTLPNNAKVFIFQADRKLTSSDVEVINMVMNSFIPKWATHGEELTAEYTILNKLFLVVGNDEERVATSGCSKDSLTHAVQSIGKQLNIDFFNRLNIAYKTGSDNFELVNMLNFKKMMQKDEISQNTIVVNNLIESKHDLLNNWQVEVKNSWHKTLAPIL
jgi:hypothetical protein